MKNKYFGQFQEAKAMKAVVKGQTLLLQYQLKPLKTLQRKRSRQ
jgi:hypothetical protein